MQAALEDKTLLSGDYDARRPSSEAPAADPLIGRTLANRYQILSLVGKGGMSVVYKARHLLLDRFVAIKIMHPHLAADQKSLKRFRVEAQSASRLSHPNITAVHDFGVLDDGQPFLSMDYVQGSSIASLLDSGEPLSLERTLNIMSQTCEALQHAHSLGVVHRDLKPSNIIISSEGGRKDFVKVVDFGIAKIIVNDEKDFEQLTLTGESLGSPPYMSPEQCQGQQLDARSDVYSAGCLFYEMITGKPPLAGRTVYETIYKQINDMPESVSKSRADLSGVSQQLDAVILKAMAKSADQRYQSMEQMKTAVDEIRQGQSRPWLARARTNWEIISYKSRHAGLPRRALLSLSLALTGLALTGILLGAWNLNHAPSKPLSQAVQSPVLPGSQSITSAYAAYLKAAQKEIDSANYPQAEKQLAMALKEAEKLGEQDSRYTDVLERMAQVLREQGKEQQAKTLEAEAARCKKFRISFGDPDSNNTKITKLNILLSTEPSNAVRQELARTLNDQASLMYWQSRLHESEQLSEQALSLGKKLLGNSNPQVARSYILLARVELAKGKLAQAEPLYKQAENILLKIKERNDPLVGDAFNNLAEFYYKVGQLQKSSAYFNQALTIYEKVFGKESPHAAECLDGLGRIATMERQFDKGEKLFLQSLAMSRATRGINHIAGGRTLANLGWLFYRQKNWSQSEAYLQQAIEIFEPSAQGDSLDLALALTCLGKDYMAEGKPAQAEPLLRRAFKIAQRIQPGSAAAIDAYKELMGILTSQRRKQEIQQLLNSVQSRPPGSQEPGH